MLCVYIYIYICESPRTPQPRRAGAIEHVGTVCEYIYIYIYRERYIHRYIHTYVRRYIHTCMHTYIHIHVYIYIYMHTYYQCMYYAVVKGESCVCLVVCCLLLVMLWLYGLLVCDVVAYLFVVCEQSIDMICCCVLLTDVYDEGFPLIFAGCLVLLLVAYCLVWHESRISPAPRARPRCCGCCE